MAATDKTQDAADDAAGCMATTYNDFWIITGLSRVEPAWNNALVVNTE